MAEYKSRYTGEEIDAGIAKANTAIQDVSNKVDKIEGKGLSTNDYTTEEKTKLADIDMSSKQDKLVSGTNIKTINNLSLLGSGNINISGGSLARGTFRNKKLFVSGDSITEKNSRASLNWHDYLKEWMGLNSVTNDGKSGTGLVKGYSSFKGLIYRLEDWDTNYDVQNCDMILYMGNMNDGTSGPTGQASWKGQRTDSYATLTDAAESLYAALNYTITQIITKYPNKPFGWIISTPRSQVGTQGACWGTYDDSGNRMWFDEWVDIIKEVCHKYNVPVLDLYHESNVLRPWNSTNNATYFSCAASPNGDGIHPNAIGQEVMASIIYEWMYKYMLPLMGDVTPEHDVHVTGVSISGDSTISTGGTTTLIANITPSDATNKNVTWSTNSPNVTLTPDIETLGLTCTVTGVNAGSATITVTTQDGNYTDTHSVTVISGSIPVTGVSISGENKVYIGGTTTLTANITPSNATNKNVTWSSSDNTVATVANGVVTGVAEGSVTITVTTQDGGFTDTHNLTVSLAPDVYDTFNREDMTGNLGYSDSGHLWDTISNSYSIVNKRAVSLKDYSVADIATNSVDGEVSATFTHKTKEFVLARVSPTYAKNWVGLELSDTALRIIQKINNQPSFEITSVPYTANVNTDYKLTLNLVGTTAIGYVNDTQLITGTVTNSTYKAYGIYCIGVDCICKSFTVKFLD